MKRYSGVRIGALSVLALLFPLLVFADVVYLKSGRKFEGKIVSQDNQNVVLETGGQKISLQVSQVERVERSGVADPGAGNAALAQARSFAKAGVLEQAFDAYQAVVADPALPPEVKNAVHLEQRGVMGKAVGALREQYKALIREGDYELCLNRVEQERGRLKPNSFQWQVRNNLEAELRGFLAEGCIDRNDFNGALKILEKSAKVENLDCPFFDAQIGAVLVHAGAYERAAKHMLRAAECYPKDHVVLRNLLVSLAQSGKTDEAVKRYVAHQATCKVDPWDPDSREAFGKACRKTAFDRAAKGRDESTLNLYAMGLEHSPIEVTLYDEAIKFYALAGLPPKVSEMTARRDELRALKERSAVGVALREAESRQRMDAIRNANQKKSADVRAEAARDAATRVTTIRLPTVASYGTSSGSSGST